jgi:hypothetical protein
MFETRLDAEAVYPKAAPEQYNMQCSTFPPLNTMFFYTRLQRPTHLTGRWYQVNSSKGNRKCKRSFN